MDAFQHHSGCSLRRSLRFQTNADIPGVEKLAVTSVKTEFLVSPLETINTTDFCLSEGGFLGTNSVFFVKGWSRSVAAITCMLHAYEMPDAFEAR